MTSGFEDTIEMGEDSEARTKQVRSGDAAARSAGDSRETGLPPRSIFLLQDIPSSSENSSDYGASDQETEMTKDVMSGRRRLSNPIAIPKIKVASFEAVHNDDPDLEHSDSRDISVGSAGGCAYDSPTLPRPSKDFSHVMIKLQHRDLQRVRSFEHVRLEDSDNESCNSFESAPISSSVPTAGIRNPKGRRTVRFDERTITVTADLGESAARFRSQWRKKRFQSSSPPTRFGESKNISICHNEASVDSPVLERANNGRSIFDVCNYSSYGRYT